MDSTKERSNVMLKKLTNNNDDDDEFRFLNAHDRCRDVSQYRLHHMEVE